MRGLPAPRHVVGAVRARVPWLRSPEQHDSRLPYVPRRPTVNPVLPVTDLDRSVDFYRALGFAVSKYDDGYAWVSTCGWEIVHLNTPDGAATPTRAGAYVHVDDADQWHVAMSAGAPEGTVGPVDDQPWGKREFAVTDPDGNRIRFGSPS